MPSRDIHSRDGGRKVCDLLGSLLVTELLLKGPRTPLYLVSPWLSDFRLLDNQFGQFDDLFDAESEITGERWVSFGEVLTEMSKSCPVRVVTWTDESSRAFVERYGEKAGITIRLEKAHLDHQKGMLSDTFYFEGSMNFTYSGVYRNREKVTCRTTGDAEGTRKLSEARLEFDRLWENLGNSNG